MQGLETLGRISDYEDAVNENAKNLLVFWRPCRGSMVERTRKTRASTTVPVSRFRSFGIRS